MGQCDLGFPVFGSRSRPKIGKGTSQPRRTQFVRPAVLSSSPGTPGIGLFLFVQSELRSRAVSGIDGYDGYSSVIAAL